MFFLIKSREHGQPTAWRNEECDFDDFRLSAKSPAKYECGLLLCFCLAALILNLAGRSEDIATAAIIVTVVLVAGRASPESAWKQPVLRLIDTIIGITVGILA